jgi:hypothetical protein
MPGEEELPDGTLTQEEVALPQIQMHPLFHLLLLQYPTLN